MCATDVQMLQDLIQVLVAAYTSFYGLLKNGRKESAAASARRAWDTTITPDDAINVYVKNILTGVRGTWSSGN